MDPRWSIVCAMRVKARLTILLPSFPGFESKPATLYLLHAVAWSRSVGAGLWASETG